MTRPSATTVKPPRKAGARPAAKPASGARMLVKAAQSVGDETGAVDNFPKGRREKAGEARKAAILKGALAVFARLRGGARSVLREVEGAGSLGPRVWDNQAVARARTQS